MYSGTNSGTGNVAENDPKGVLVERAIEVETVRIVERAELAQDYNSLYHQSKVALEASAKQVKLPIF
jgi:hypothetical protein